MNQSAPSTVPAGVGIYAPAGHAIDPAAIDRAVARLEAAGHHVVVDPTATTRWQRFSAVDDERLAAIVRMTNDPRVDVAIAVRGGYGWSRLLNRIDFGAIAASRKRWLGHSDFTAFQLAAYAATGMVSYAGPMVAYDFGAESPSAFTFDHCWGLLDHHTFTAHCALEGPAAAEFSAAGTLWGGNLAMVAHLIGTAYMPAINDGILFLEDVGEHPYRIERMLYQLRYAGILARQRAVLLGSFTNFELGANDDGYDLAAMIEHARRRFEVPIFTGLPFGHRRDKLTLPLGGHCALKVAAGAATLHFSDYALARIRA